ncbi:hypothetical protein T4C_10684 [Trichinella pseudospiralis]|uniref:Uncharacterized protein n=1 Tax=Trichinella pseudospiralis TaxID=6337 RepID=A0A0V1JVZ6_TRIPS|nr:hypothetical protein T4C_10684 [Trichinella pseudospiralis]
MELIPVKERAYPPEIRMTERLLISTDVEDVLELPDERYESERSEWSQRFNLSRANILLAGKKQVSLLLMKAKQFQSMKNLGVTWSSPDPYRYVMFIFNFSAVSCKEAVEVIMG